MLFLETKMMVCPELFPKGSRSYQKEDGFFIDDMLKEQLDILIKNITNDWDFTIIITGGGQVRQGKSVLAMAIGMYWTYQINKIYNKKTSFNVQDNFIFDGKRLIEMGNKLGKEHPYSVLLYDEAGADLDGTKVMQSATQEVLDYYRECGQYNMLNILVIPEFFSLPRGIALSRSIFLIDVSAIADENQIFQRGHFNFYSRRQKKKLYLQGKKELNYNAVPYDFRGRFSNFYPINEEDYRKAKQEALSKRESRKRNKFQLQRDACWYLLNAEYHLNQMDIGKRMENLTGIFVAQNTISDALKHYKIEEEAGFK